MGHNITGQVSHFIWTPLYNGNTNQTRCLIKIAHLVLNECPLEDPTCTAMRGRPPKRYKAIKNIWDALASGTRHLVESVVGSPLGPAEGLEEARRGGGPLVEAPAEAGEATAEEVWTEEALAEAGGARQRQGRPRQRQGRPRQRQGRPRQRQGRPRQRQGRPRQRQGRPRLRRCRLRRPCQRQGGHGRGRGGHGRGRGGHGRGRGGHSRGRGGHG